MTKQRVRQHAMQLYAQARTHKRLTLPPWSKRLTALLARASALAILLWMFYDTYQDRHLLLTTLHISPLYLLPVAASYASGFALAVVSWHWLLRLSGVQHDVLDNYTLYTYMSVCRNVPIPYFYVASMMYTYQQRGTPYPIIGLTIVATSVLHIVAGVLVFLFTMLLGFSLDQHIVIQLALLMGGLVAMLLHPKIFTWLIRLKQPATDPATLPPITWATTLALLVINVLVLLIGGCMVFFCARAILDVPVTLLPVCIASWSLIVSATNLIAWLPSDFGLTRLLLIVLFQGHLPIALVTAIYAMWRVCALVLDIINAGVATLLCYQQKGRQNP